MTTVHSKRMHMKKRAPRGRRLRRCLCMGVATVAMIRCAQANADGIAIAAPRDVAADQSAFHRRIDRNTDLSSLSFTQTPLTTAPAIPTLGERALQLSTPEMLQQSAYSSEFRPRRRSSADSTASLSETPNPLSSNPTVWQQMRDYRVNGRVRVLTLWDSTGGTVSLQAGKGGSPSLQWTSSWMSRGDAKRGVLDSLFAVSLAGAANTIRNVTHGGLPGQNARDATKLATAAIAGPTAH